MCVTLTSLSDLAYREAKPPPNWNRWGSDATGARSFLESAATEFLVSGTLEAAELELDLTG